MKNNRFWQGTTRISEDGKEKAKTTDCKGEKIGRNDPCPCGSGKNIKLPW